VKKPFQLVARRPINRRSYLLGENTFWEEKNKIKTLGSLQKSSTTGDKRESDLGGKKAEAAST